MALFFLSIAFLNPWTLSWFTNRFKKGITEYRLSYKRLTFMCIIFCFVWILGGIQLFFVGKAIYPLGFQNLGYVIGCWSIVGVLSYAFLFLPSNFGFSEVSLSLLLSTIMPSSLAVVVAILNRIQVILFEIAVACLVLGYNYFVSIKTDKKR